MRKKLLIVFLFLFTQIAYADDSPHCLKFKFWNNETRQIKTLLNSQVRYANNGNFDKFISTYDKNYVNSDGLNLETYSSLVKDIWNTYDNIVYGVKIDEINVLNDEAKVKVIESSHANIPVSKEMSGILTSKAESVYALKKTDGKWKVVSDKVLKENTSMLYGEAQKLDIKLSAPETVSPNTEYCASLEFSPPKGAVAIASIAMDKVEYPQKEAKEVFRRMPEDNILERLFVSNQENKNEYIVASIGLTRTDVSDLSIKLTLIGFGYQITRVNVLPNSEEKHVQGK